MTNASHDELTPEQVLRDAGDARASLAKRGRWQRTYLLGFSAGSLAIIWLVGLGGKVGLILAMSLWVALISVLVAWASRQRVQPRGAMRRQGWAWGTWAVVYGAAIVCGEVFFQGRVGYWIPAGIVVAAVLVVWALLPMADPGTRPRR